MEEGYRLVTVQVPVSLLRRVDDFIRNSPRYKNRAQFIRDALKVGILLV